MKLTYRIRPFGQASSAAVIALGLPVAVVAGAASGWLHQKAVLALAWLAVPALVVSAAVPGVVLALLGLRLRCRSRALLAALGIVGGAAAAAAGWAVALQHARDHDLVWVESKISVLARESRDLLERSRDLTRAPPRERAVAGTETVRARTLAEYVDFRVRRGWPERGYEYSGLVVWAAWAGEAGLFLGVAAVIATACARVPLRCAVHRYAMATVLDAWVQDVDIAALAAAAEREDLDAILAAPRLPGSGRRARYVVHRCPACELGVVSVAVRGRGVVVDAVARVGERADELAARLAAG